MRDIAESKVGEQSYPEILFLGKTE